MDKIISENNTLLVSVLMCVYNGDKYLAAAIDSILSQTYSNFEFVIIDDGSTDESYNVISTFIDPRIRLIKNEINKGLIASLNMGLLVAKGKLIARMDADDISYPQRLQTQIDFLASHPSIGVCGSWVNIIDSEKVYKLPVSHNEIKVAMLNDNPMAHPSVMFDNDLFKEHSFSYNNDYIGAEDYELWSRAIFKINFANIPIPLLGYRIHAAQVTKSKKILVEHSSQKIKLNLINEFGISPDENQQRIHLFLFNQQYKEHRGIAILQKADEWLYHLFTINKKLHLLNQDLFCDVWKTKLFVTAIDQYDMSVWKILFHSHCFHFANVTLKQKITLLIKCLIKRKVGK